MAVVADAFDELQLQLGPALHANRPGSGIEHVMVTLPSFSVSESILSHYGDRIPSLEHRYLTAVLIVGRITDCHTVIVLSRLPDPEIFEYYLQLVPADERASARSRTTMIEVQDGTSRSVAAKLLDRPDLLDQIRETIGDKPALIEPWNVTNHEVELALALGVPINGSNPRVRGLGFKSEGRRLMRRAGVPVPFGVEDVRSVEGVVAAVRAIREARPDAPGVVIKHDDSGAGDGNVVLDLGPMDAATDPDAWLLGQVEGLAEWYRADLERGGIVEERIAATRFSSPSAQVDIRPDGRVYVLATHEQVLGGESGQVYLGCRFPADPAYAPELARHAAAIGELLAEAGALGRFSVDFVASADEAGPWRVHALEINLRKGGTTHPYAAMRNVVPGRYESETGRWLTEDGGTRCYSATDNLVDPSWAGMAPTAVIDAVAAAGLPFDPATGKGVILHMLSGLAIDGRFGLTAIAETPDEAARMHDATRTAVAALR
jgi:pheganomycin biosynthesis PGM1-like protein